MTSKRELLLAAIEKLSHSDVKHMTVSKLASLIGLTRSSLYKYYPDIISRLHSVQSARVENVKSQGALKLQLLKDKVRDQHSIIVSLTTICSNQLIELSELKASTFDEQEALRLKIAFLESQLSKLRKPGLKIVK